MKILAIDTSTNILGIAIIDGEDCLIELSLNTGKTHSAYILEGIDYALQLLGLHILDIDGFGVTNGPGSFTGLRIGLSTIKGLALASEKPVATVSSLDALIYLIPPMNHLICPLIDARKGQVYYSLYCDQHDCNHGYQRRQLCEIGVISPHLLSQHIQDSCLFIGSGAVLYKELLCESMGKNFLFVPNPLHIIRPSVIAKIALEELTKHTHDNLSTIVPTYIRPPDAKSLRSTELVFRS
ncbi:MAG: tRNA (adenosine(37)-N6)-threonylcarbamoyltransferase complex dimerization subunit type 1 TsaB [Desulfobacterales bacterium]|nr:tRNA (adenosine(37)-N6)-threonylcarbamoyltransferase complex dimerization subunit type 1 TsaB [Desulfobacterales bacterium]